MSMAALPRRIRGGGSSSLFFITVAARQRQMFSRDGHLWFKLYPSSGMKFFF
jgi:hypothetical protein